MKHNNSQRVTDIVEGRSPTNIPFDPHNPVNQVLVDWQRLFVSRVCLAHLQREPCAACAALKSAGL